jgi:DNA repair exonuclease SbcCD ATPase subunit
MVELIKLEIEGFGKFDKKKIIKFNKGVNFINGLNEAGKSTILEAILASLFNYTKLNIKPLFCWKNEDVCKLVLDYKTDNGELFQIISDYKNEK